jgi:hypothetical protein
MERLHFSTHAGNALDYFLRDWTSAERLVANRRGEASSSIWSTAFRRTAARTGARHFAGRPAG